MYFRRYQWWFILLTFSTIFLLGFRNFGTDYGYYISIFRSLVPVYWEIIPASARTLGVFHEQVPFIFINLFIAILFFISVRKNAFPVIYCFIFLSVFSPHIMGAFREGFGHALILMFTLAGLPNLYFIAFFAHKKFFIVFIVCYIFSKILITFRKDYSALKFFIVFSFLVKIIVFINYNYEFLVVSKNLQVTGLLLFDGLDRREPLDWFILSLWRFIRLCFFAYLLSSFIGSTRCSSGRSQVSALPVTAAPLWFCAVFVSDVLFDCFSPFSIGISGRGVGSLAIFEILFFASLKKPFLHPAKPFSWVVLMGLASMYCVKLLHTLNYQIQITEDYQHGDAIYELF